MPTAQRSALAFVCVACAWFGAGSHTRAYDGEDMAPGLARLSTLAPDGAITVRVLDTAFAGRWRRAEGERDTALLRQHWRGGRAALEREQERLSVAELRGNDGTRLRCEFINDADLPMGVCAQDGSRLYYLGPAAKPK